MLAQLRSTTATPAVISIYRLRAVTNFSRVSRIDPARCDEPELRSRILVAMNASESDARTELRIDRWSKQESGDAYADNRFSNSRSAGRDPRMARALMRRFPLDQPAARILDVPSGTGRLHEVASGLAERVVGIDNSTAMLARGYGARICASAWRLPFRDNSFEVVLCCRLLHHLPDDASRSSLLTELARVAKHRILLSFWDATSLHALRRRLGLRRSRKPDSRVPIERTQLEQLARSAGLELLGYRASARFLSPQTFCALRPFES
ncbi:MAG: SAM-dependent methyltransferase [Planctomycetota bacterium]|jgi:SAM-dependent methyltransferase